MDDSSYLIYNPEIYINLYFKSMFAALPLKNYNKLRHSFITADVFPLLENGKKIA